MYQRTGLLVVAVLCLPTLLWGQPAQSSAPLAKPGNGAGTLANLAKAGAGVEVEGVGVVHLPADGVRILATMQLRMPTLKETVAEEERRAAKLEQAWRDLKLGSTKIYLLDQRFQEVRQPDPNQPNMDLTDQPVIGYIAYRLYTVEITGLPAERLPEAARLVQKVTLEQGGQVGIFGRPTPWGVEPIEAMLPGEGRPVPSATYFVSDPEAAYRQALKKATENALAKVNALYGDRAAVRTFVQELRPSDGSVLEAPVVPHQYDIIRPATRRKLPAALPTVEVVAAVKVVCQY